MERFLSAVMGELASRSISFLIDRYWKSPALSKEESLRRLQWMLLRVHVTVEEAERRCITNQAMLRHLNMMREEMYRGYYVLDTFRYQFDEGKTKDCEVSRSLALSKFNHSNRVCFSASTSKHGLKVLEEMLQSVEIIINGMDEFIIFLNSYSPPMYHQPYSMYLFMEKCMFGRQMEMERVISFLLQREPPGDGNVGVLPIVGPRRVGKSTLVEYICYDERVRNHFSQIIFYRENEFREEKLRTLRDGGITKHQCSDMNEERLLVVIDLAGDVDEGAWRRLYSASRRCIPSGSKIIITSRSEKITNFGTTQAFSLKFLSREAYWYFFKVLLFGSTDPEEQPKLASIARDIFEESFDQERFRELTGPFVDSKNFAGILRANVNVRHWHRVLASVKYSRKKNQLLFSTSPTDIGMNNRLIYLQRIGRISQYCVLHTDDRVGFAYREVPKMTMQELMCGNATPHGKFEVVAWRSHLPPYHYCIYSCEIRESHCMDDSKKLCQKRKI